MKRLFFSIVLSTIIFIGCETQPNASTSDQEVQKREEYLERQYDHIGELKEYYEEYLI